MSYFTNIDINLWIIEIHFKFFNGCLPQILLVPTVKTLTQIFNSFMTEAIII